MRYPQPNNEHEFELLCLDVLREALSRPGLVQHGHRGERQHGVDLVDLAAESTRLAVQCKHHKPYKTLPPAELQAEVDKALRSPLRIDEYIVATTARRSAATQRRIAELNVAHRERGAFQIRLLTWEDLEEMIPSSHSALRRLGFGPVVAPTQNAGLDPHTSTLTAASPPSKRVLARYEAVAFIEAPRAAELALLEESCSDESRNLDVLLFTGPAGAGKTRLLQHFCRALRDRGWSAGFLPLGQALAMPAPSPARTLIVIDYAEARLASVVEVLRRLAEAPSHFTRVVLLARSQQQWWSHLRSRVSWLDDMADERAPLALGPLSRDHASLLQAAARAGFGVSAGLAPDFGALSLPGEITIAALLASEDATTQVRSAGDTVERLALHERKYWSLCATGEIGVPSQRFEEHCTAVVVVAYLTGGGATYDETRKVAELLVPAFSPAALEASIETLLIVYGAGCSGMPNRLQPDLLGEHLVLRVLGDKSNRARTRLVDTLVHTQSANALLLTLANLSSRDATFRMLLGNCLRHNFSYLLQREELSDALTHGVLVLNDGRLSADLLASTDESSSQVRGALLHVRVVAAPPLVVGSAGEHASSVVEYLDLLPKLETGISPFDEERMLRETIDALHAEATFGKVVLPSTASLRRLSLGVPTAKLPRTIGDADAAGSRDPELVHLLIQHSLVLLDPAIDRQVQASQVLWEAKELCRRLVSAGYAYAGHLSADYHHALSLAHLRASRWSDAREASTIAVSQRRRIFGTDPGAGGALARSLTNLAISAQKLGDSVESLAALSEARALMPEGDADWGRLLYNLGMIKWWNGRDSAAIGDLAGSLAARLGLFDRRRGSRLVETRDVETSLAGLLHVAEEGCPGFEEIILDVLSAAEHLVPFVTARRRQLGGLLYAACRKTRLPPEVYARALGTARLLLGASHEEAPVLLFYAGLCNDHSVALIRTGASEAAIAAAEAGVAAHESALVLGVDRSLPTAVIERARIRNTLATAFYMGGRLSEARESVKWASELLLSAPSDVERDRVRTRTIELLEDEELMDGHSTWARAELDRLCLCTGS